MLRSPIPGVDTVTNPRPALGGVDAEPLDHARAPRGDGDPHALPRGHRRGLRVPRRRGVAARRARRLPRRRRRRRRSRCTSSRTSTRPTAGSAYEELVPDERAADEVAEYLDERRLIGTTVAAAAVRASAASPSSSTCRPRPLADTGARRGGRRARALHVPQPARRRQRPHGRGGGWPFGRALNQGELYGIVHAVDGVEFVKILRIYETNLVTGEQSAKPAGHAHRARARRADRLRRAHRQGDATGSC